MRGRRLVLVGGGHAHLAVLRHFADRPEPGLSLSLIAREPRALYFGMIPGVIARDYDLDAAAIPLAPLARAARAQVLAAEVCGIDLAAGFVRCTGGEAVPFDLVSLDIGGVADLSVPGAVEHALPTRPLEGLLTGLAELDSLARHGPTPMLVAVVGGGAAGCELALALTARYRRAARITLVSGSPTLLPGFPRAAGRRIEDILTCRLARVVAGAPVVALERGLLRRADGAYARVDAVVWATGVAAPPWLRAAGLALDERGFVLVDRSLRSVTDARVFAAGDVAAISSAAVPKAGVWAVRAGAVLAENLRRAVRGEPLRAWRPQRRALVLINTGWKRAIGVWGPFVFEGRWVWRWKTSIDRRFIDRHRLADIR